MRRIELMVGVVVLGFSWVVLFGQQGAGLVAFLVAWLLVCLQGGVVVLALRALVVLAFGQACPQRDAYTREAFPRATRGY